MGVSHANGRRTVSSTVPFTKPPRDLDVQFPIVDGVIIDYDLYQKTWEDDMEMYLKSDLKGLPVLLAEKPYQTPAARYK